MLDYRDLPPPIASLITIGTPGPDGTTQVTGAPGAVLGGVDVIIATLEYFNPQFLRSGPDGSFTASLISAPGATIQVRHNPYDSVENYRLESTHIHQLNHWPGTLIRVPDALVDGAGLHYSGAGVSIDREDGYSVLWGVAGTVSDRNVRPGESVHVSGTLRAFIPPGVVAPSSLTSVIQFGVDLVFDGEGRQTARGSNFVSRLLNPNGLPIERDRGFGFTTIHESSVTLRRQTGAMVGSFETMLRVPTELPAGTYRLYLGSEDLLNADFLGRRHPDDELSFNHLQPFNLVGEDGATIALLAVGSPEPPRLSPTILVDSPAQGARGTIAIEGRGHLELASRIATQPGVFVIEPSNLGDGQPIPYRLEPFFPLLSLADRDLPNAPVVPLALPGGSLSVTVRTPRGTIENLGVYPVLQTRTGQAATSAGLVLNDSGGNAGDVLQLTTLAEALSYRFVEYGRYTITLSGSVSDIWGEEYPVDGTFEVWVAEALDLETASLPSTPFRVGDQLPAVVSVYPGVPADIEMSFVLHSIAGSATKSDSVTGKANRFGYFDGGGKVFSLDRVGEYVVRLRASYTDGEGRLWMGTRRWGSGVAPKSPALIAHGRRGDDGQPTSEQRAWFTLNSTGLVPGGHHASFPYHSGDIMWARDDYATQMRVTIHDTVGQVADLLQDRAHQSRYEAPDFDARRLTSDLPLLISTSSGLEPTFAIDSVQNQTFAEPPCPRCVRSSRDPNISRNDHPRSFAHGFTPEKGAT